MKAIMEKVILRAWADEDFRKAFVKDPKKTLEEYGLKFPDETKVEVLENSETKLYFILPANPNPKNKNEDFLEAAAKMTASTDCCLSTMTGPTKDFTC